MKAAERALMALCFLIALAGASFLACTLIH